MFVLFAQHGVSYTPSYNFRPYYPYFQTSEICDFTWVSFRIIFFFFPSSFYHHSSFSIAERQCILKSASYLFLILLFLDSSVFPWLWSPFFFSHIFVNHFLPLDSSQFLLFENTPLSVSHYLFCALLWYFWLPAEVVLHLIPHFLGTEEKRMNKRERGARETCSFYILTLNLWLWGPSRNVVNEMINIQSMWLLSYFSFPPPPMGFFFLNSLHSVHCCSSILLLEWELYAGNCMSLWHRLRPTLDTHWQTNSISAT